MAGEFVIDAFAGGDAMCWCGGHVYEEIIPKGVNGANDVERFTAGVRGRREKRERSPPAAGGLHPLSRGQDDDARRIVSGGFGRLSGCLYITKAKIPRRKTRPTC